MNLPDDEELNEIAWKEFVSEVESLLIEFEHVVDEKTGSVIFNERNIKLIVENYIELKSLAKNFIPYFGGHNDQNMAWNYTEELWDAIWECWKINPK